MIKGAVYKFAFALRWRHNDHAGVSNHQPHGCLLTRLFRCKSKKTSKLRVTGLCAGNSPGTGEFPAQMTSYAENVSIWWRHHGFVLSCVFSLAFAVKTDSDIIKGIKILLTARGKDKIKTLIMVMHKILNFFLLCGVYLIRKGRVIPVMLYTFDIIHRWTTQIPYFVNFYIVLI